MHIDPAEILPAELVFLIMELVEPEKIWTLRVLSRRWNALLSQDTLVEAVLRQGETHDPSDAAPRSRAARESAFWSHLRARPLGTVDVQFDKPESFEQHMPFLKGKYLAFLHRRDSICVINLQTQVAAYVETGHVSQFVLTDTMLISVSGGLQYRYLDDLETAHVLPLTDISAIAGYGQYLAVVQRLKLSIFNGQDLVRSVDLPDPRMPRYGTALYMADCTLVLFYPQSTDGRFIRASASLVRVSDTVEVCQFAHTASTQQAAGVDILSSGDGEYYHASGRGYTAKMHYHRIGSKLERLNWRSEARWKGNVYTKPTYRNWSTIRTGKGALVKSGVDEFVDSQLLINDSYLISWFGGPECLFDVLTFDKQEGMMELPVVEELTRTGKWCWMKEVPKIDWDTP